jgi:hypothetical protein
LLSLSVFCSPISIRLSDEKGFLCGQTARRARIYPRVYPVGILVRMETQPQIIARIRQDLPNILASWREERRETGGDEPSEHMAAMMEELIGVFAGFLESPQGVESFNRGGEIRSLVARIAAGQHDLGRDAVGVIEDFSVLRRCVWNSVEQGVDFAGMLGEDVAAFFVKLIQASDWVTEHGLEAFEATARREMEQALGRGPAQPPAAARRREGARGLLRCRLRRRQLY